MEYHKVNPILSKVCNILIANFLFPTREYQKENLTESSYVFAPNHTNNWDGYQIWSLLSQDYDLDVFMYKEFWDTFPLLSKVLLFFNVYPITRNKLILNELKNELIKLKDENHSLIIFPQGRHVDPEVMVNLFDYDLETIPLGSFFLAAKSGKKIVPVYLETQKPFSDNTVIYGNPIDPCDYGILSLKEYIQKEQLLFLREAWLKEINKSYSLAKEFTNRKMHDYPLHKKYSDATGLNHNELKDPNSIIKYLEEIKSLKSLSEKEKIDDIYKLGEMLGLSSFIIKEIDEVRQIYERHLVRK